MSAQPVVLLDPRKRPMTENSEPVETVLPVTRTDTRVTARGRHKTIRSILGAAAGSVLRFADKYAYYSRLGYTREAARRKALWHIR